jgi:NADH:ubiquinone oxidoreductase subunit D
MLLSVYLDTSSERDCANRGLKQVARAIEGTEGNNGYYLVSDGGGLSYRPVGDRTNVDC